MVGPPEKRAHGRALNPGKWSPALWEKGKGDPGGGDPVPRAQTPQVSRLHLRRQHVDSGLGSDGAFNACRVYTPSFPIFK